MESLCAYLLLFALNKNARCIKSSDDVLFTKLIGHLDLRLRSPVMIVKIVEIF